MVLWCALDKTIRHNHTHTHTHTHTQSCPAQPLPPCVCINRLKLLGTIRLTSEEDGKTRWTKSITLLISGVTDTHQNKKREKNDLNNHEEEEEEEEEGLWIVAMDPHLQHSVGLVTSGFVSLLGLKIWRVKVSQLSHSGVSRFSVPGKWTELDPILSKRLHVQKCYHRRSRKTLSPPSQPHRGENELCWDFKFLNWPHGPWQLESADPSVIYKRGFRR